MKLCKIFMFFLLAISSATPWAQNFPDWRAMDQQTLDDSYNNSKAVPESSEVFKQWIEKSQAFRASHSQFLDIPYGTLPREKLDYFSAGPNTPVVIFIHGGFWQMRAKDDFAFLAQTYLKEGISVVMVGYPLAPDASMDQIVASSRKAVSYIGQHIAAWGGNPDHVVLSGWSSGGHLAIASMGEMKLKAVVPVSGIYELEPLVGTYLNKKLQMDLTMAKRNSPMLDLPHGKTPIYLFVGGSELIEMRRQSFDLDNRLKAIQYPVTLQEIAGKNHYTMLEQFGFEQGAIHRQIISVINGRGN